MELSWSRLLILTLMGVWQAMKVEKHAVTSLPCCNHLRMRGWVQRGWLQQAAHVLPRVGVNHMEAHHRVGQQLVGPGGRGGEVPSRW